MKDLSYYCRKFAWLHLGFKRDVVNKLFEEEGVKIGKNVAINSNILTSESYLIEIGDNVTISDHVSFVTHDNSISKALPGSGNLFGKIIIGNNCFIGAHTILMYGVTLAENVIVASGSVVVKSVTESGVIIGGNPAKIIGKADVFAEKSKDKAIRVASLSKEEKKSLLLGTDKLVIR